MGDNDQQTQTDDNQQGLAGTSAVSKEPAAAAAAAAAAGKEQEPGDNSLKELGVEEAPSEYKELEPDKEVGKFVQPTPVAPKLPADVGKAGVRHTGPTTPLQKKPTKTITLPLTDDQIVQGLHAHIWESIRWLAVWCIRKLRKVHIIVKEVHGRLVRS